MTPDPRAAGPQPGIDTSVPHTADPIVPAHARALLSREQQDRVTIVAADLREPEQVLADPSIRGVIDFDRPAG